MKYAVIDISSSSISMIAAAAEAQRAEVVFKERSALSLVHYLGEEGLSPRGTEKLLEILNRYKETAVELGVERCYLIATAALRHVKNFADIAHCVQEGTGLVINLIDGETEAYCDYVANTYFKTFERPVLIDLGGKSIEICGRNPSTLPIPPSSPSATKERSTGEGMVCARAASTREKSDSIASRAMQPGIPAPKVR